MSLALIETGHCNMDLKPSPIEPSWILEIVIESEGMPPRRYGVGDVILLRDGAHVKWPVESYVKKIAFLRQTLSVGLGYAVRAINKLKRLSFVPGGRRSAPQPDPAPLYDLVGKSTRDTAPARSSWLRMTHNVN